MKYYKAIIFIFAFLLTGLSVKALAATEFVTTVNTDGNGDYSSLSLWEAAIDSNLTATTTTKVIAGSLTRGSFSDGVAVTQTTSGATATMLHDTATQIMLISITGTPNSTNTWYPTADGNDTTNAWTPTDAGDSVIARANLSGTVADTTAVTIDGWTTNATNYIILSGNYAVSSGPHYSTSYYRMERSSTILTISEDYTLVDKLQMKMATSSGSSLHSININSATGVVVSNSVIFQNLTGSASGNAILYGGQAGESATLYNIAAYGASSSGNSDGFRIITAGTLNAYNVTVSSFTNGIRLSAGSSTIANCAVFNNTVDFNGTPTSATYCASDDTLTGTGNIDWANGSTDWNNNFMDYTNGDFHLKTTAPDLINTGTADPGSGLFSNDIDGQARFGSWDIGADEYFPVKIIIRGNAKTRGSVKFR